MTSDKDLILDSHPGAFPAAPVEDLLFTQTGADPAAASGNYPLHTYVDIDSNSIREDPYSPDAIARDAAYEFEYEYRNASIYYHTLGELDAVIEPPSQGYHAKYGLRYFYQDRETSAPGPGGPCLRSGADRRARPAAEDASFLLANLLLHSSERRSNFGLRRGDEHQ